jgi:hypothetical protein
MTLLTQCHFVLSMVESYWKEAVFKIPNVKHSQKKNGDVKWLKLKR